MIRLTTKQLLLAGFLLTFFGASPQAQGFLRYQFQHIFPGPGHNNLFTRKIVKDPYGFIWIGTEDGLSRYDGRNIIGYNQGIPGPHSITGVDIRDLLVDTARQLIWEINSYKGIDAIDYRTGNVVFRYFQKDNRSTADIRFTSLILQGDRLYIGSTNGVFVLETHDRQLHKLDIHSPLHAVHDPLQVDDMLADHSGRLWIFCVNHGVLLLRDKEAGKAAVVLDAMKEDRLLLQGEPQVQFFDGTLLRDGAVLSSSNTGLRLFSLDSKGRITVNNDPYPQAPLSHGKNTYACGQDGRGNIWFCVPGHLVRITRNGAFDIVREHRSGNEQDWVNAAYALFFDEADNLWLGCQQGLAFSPNRPSGFFCIDKSPDAQASIQHAYYLNPVNDSLLYCNAQDGLYQVSPAGGEIRHFATRETSYHTFRDPLDRLMISNIDGTFIYKGGRLIPLEKASPEFRPLGNIQINSHCAVGDSVLVFGTQNVRGVIAWNYRRGTARFIDRDTPGGLVNDNTVKTVFCDPNGLVWVLGEKSVSILDLAKHTSRLLNIYDPARAESYSIFCDVCRVKDKYYVASYGMGVAILDSSLHLIKNLSMNNGLSSNSVYKILPYKDSLLFVTSNNGLSLVDINNHYHIKNYYESDGLHSNNFEENSGAVRNNIIYAGGANGLTVIDPVLLPAHPLPPRLFLREVRIDARSGVTDTSNLLLRSLKIPNDVQQTTFYFSSINYPNADRTTFNYRIKEKKENWIDIGTHDFVSISEPPGKYTLQVRAANEDGVWSQPIELSLQFLPKWYQTTWFALLVIAITCGLLYALYRYRLWQIHQQQQIRKDIASDLHDDIGSTLNTVKIFTHLAKREQQKEEHLTHIEESLAEATMGLRDMIWVLDDSQDTIHELSERIKKFAIPVTGANNIHFECAIGEGLDDQAISKTEKRNLLLIAKETINNSIKYAGCGHIRVSIRQENTKLSLSIQDDGKGFDTRDPSQGNGLRNIQQRAVQIRYESRITSSPDNGTLIEIIEC